MAATAAHLTHHAEEDECMMEVPKYDASQGCTSGIALLGEALPQPEGCKGVSSLLDDVLQIDPHARPSACQLLGNSWLFRNQLWPCGQAVTASSEHSIGLRMQPSYVSVCSPHMKHHK